MSRRTICRTSAYGLGTLKCIPYSAETACPHDKRPSGPLGIVRRPQVGKPGKQIAMRPYLVFRHLPVCEDSQEGVTGVVGERPAIVREGCWAGGVIGQHVRQQCPCCSPCFLRRIPTCMLQSVCKD